MYHEPVAFGPPMPEGGFYTAIGEFTARADGRTEVTLYLPTGRLPADAPAIFRFLEPMSESPSPRISAALQGWANGDDLPCPDLET